MNGFNTRVFVSLSLALSTVSLIMSSVILYIAPFGRDAFWVNWSFLSMTKEQWTACHIITGFAFLVFILCHMGFNIKPLAAYLSGRAQAAFNYKTELFVSLALFIFLSAGSVLDVPPFAQALSFGTRMQESWVKDGQRAPMPHAELLTLGALAEKLGLDYTAMLARVAEAGLEFDPEKTIKENAAANTLSPAGFFTKASGGAVNPGQGGGRGAGKGRRNRE